MITIKASGSSDVRALKKLASALQAEEVEIAPPEVEAVPPRRQRKPSVSTLPGAQIAPRTREAIFALQHVEIEPVGEYELP